MVMGKWWIPCYFLLQIRIPRTKLTRIEWFMHWNRKTDFWLKLSAKSVQNLRPCRMKISVWLRSGVLPDINYSPFFVSSTLTQRFPDYWVRALLSFCWENKGNRLSLVFMEWCKHVIWSRSQKRRVHVVRRRRQITKPAVRVCGSLCLALCVIRVFLEFIQHSIYFFRRFTTVFGGSRLLLYFWRFSSKT